MAATKPDEAGEDRAIGQMIAAKLRQQIHPAEKDCPEGETLAAFYDRALTDKERIVCEDHLVSCLRCQEFVAELARLSDVDEPPPFMIQQAAAAAAKEDEDTGWHFPLAWLAPVFIALVIAGFWYREDVLRFINPPQETAVNIPPPEPEPEKPQVTRVRAGKQPESAKTASNADLSPKAAAPPAESAKPAAPEAGLGTFARISGLSRKREEVITANAPAAAGAVQPPGSDSRLKAEAKQAEAADRVVSAQVATATSASEAQRSEAGPHLAKSASAELSGVTVRGELPTFSPKWRVGRHGTIQRADQSGGWTNVSSGSRDDLFDISFAGATAGWVVGHEGTVLRSTDGGATWTRVSSPIDEDLVHVNAESDRQAQVGSRTGRVFSTTDGGRTWKEASSQ